MKENVVANSKQQRLSLEQSLKSMEADVDNYLTLIDEKNDISNLVKPNTSRKTVPEKKDSMKILTRKLENCSAC